MDPLIADKVKEALFLAEELNALMKAVANAGIKVDAEMVSYTWSNVRQQVDYPQLKLNFYQEIKSV